MQSVFQFSIHIEKEKGVCDEVNDNYYFLPSDFSDQREELIKKNKKVDKHPHNWEKIFINHISDKGLVSKIHKGQL